MAVLAMGSSSAKLAFFATLAGETNATVSLHLREAPDRRDAAELALATLLRRKGRVLDASADLLRTLVTNPRPEDAGKLAALASARSMLATRLLGGPRPGETVEQHGQQTEASRAEVEQLEHDLSERYAGLRIDRKSVTLEAVTRAIPEGSALVEIASFRPFDFRASEAGDRFGEPVYVAYVLDRKGAPRFVELGPAKPIDDLATELRRALDGRAATRRSRDLLRELDAKVMEPIRPLLGGARDLLVAPDGALNLVPFAALVDAQGRYLLDGYRVTYLTSGRDLLRWGERLAPRSGPVLVVGPDYDAGPADAAHKHAFPPLAGAAEEAGMLRALFPKATLVEAAAATEASLEALRAPELLHVSTHGFFQPAGKAASDAERLERALSRSGLALAGANRGGEAAEGTAASGEGTGDDGLLTALEVASLDLHGTRLVTLSACETGVGEQADGDGIYGLRRALVLAGSETQLVSLWRVEAHATARLLGDYYGRIGAGEGRSEALRQAQLAMLADTATAHPYFWAAMLVQGDPRSLDGSPSGPIEGLRVRPGPRGCGCEAGGSGEAPSDLLAMIAAAVLATMRQRRADASLRSGRIPLTRSTMREGLELCGRHPSEAGRPAPRPSQQRRR